MESDKLMKKIDKELTAVKFKAFGKVKVKKKGAVDKNLLNLQNERNNLLSETVESSEKEEKLLSLEEKLAKAVQTKQREGFEKEIENIRDIRQNKGTTAALFRIREKIVGSRKTISKAVCIRDPQSGFAVNTIEGIKMVQPFWI